ncbi:MAG: hypothetical protein J6H31_07160 [Butyrivibrio sp.]|nr:hypothetical protein [Butyrivibrio sp.]
MRYDINAFYENMYRILDERDIPLKEIYTAIGMAQANFSNAYNRKNGKKFSINQMLAIAEYLGCSLDFLFTNKIEDSGERYLKIPEMSKWTYADFFQLIFSLRKSGSELTFVNTKVTDKFNQDVEVTAITFLKTINLQHSFWDDHLINSVIKEWAQILDSTESLDDDSKELMINTWEQKKIQQLENIVLADDHKSYVIDEKTKQYQVVTESK